MRASSRFRASMYAKNTVITDSESLGGCSSPWEEGNVKSCKAYSRACSKGYRERALPPPDINYFICATIDHIATRIVRMCASYVRIANFRTSERNGEISGVAANTARRM